MRTEAALRAAQAGIVAALEALVLTLLARIVARLDCMLALWQAGRLPVPPPHRAPPACQVRTATRAHPPIAWQRTRARCAAPHVAPAPGTAATPRTAAAITPPRLTMTLVLLLLLLPPRNRPPPWLSAENSPTQSLPTHAYFVTLSKYNNPRYPAPLAEPPRFAVMLSPA